MRDITYYISWISFLATWDFYQGKRAMDKRSCCLCREKIAEIKGKSKQKKLYGEHFAEETRRLDDFCATFMARQFR